MSLEWVKRRVRISGGFFFLPFPLPSASRLGKPHPQISILPPVEVNHRWNILLKNEKSYLHAVLFKVIYSPAFRNCTTLKGDVECVLVVVIVGVGRIGAVVKTVGGLTVLNISVWKDAAGKKLTMSQNASGVLLPSAN